MTRSLSVPAWLVLGSLLVGCPDSRAPTATGGAPDPQPIQTGAPTMTTTVPVPATRPTIAGGWSVAVTSEPPGINPDMLESPEQKAKLLFDHFARAADGKVTVEHKILGTNTEVEASAAADLDAHMNGVDWALVMQAAQKDGATEGGTSFKFAITVGQASW